MNTGGGGDVICKELVEPQGTPGNRNGYGKEYSQVEGQQPYRAAIKLLQPAAEGFQFLSTLERTEFHATGRRSCPRNLLSAVRALTIRAATLVCFPATYRPRATQTATDDTVPVSRFSLSSHLNGWFPTT